MKLNNINTAIISLLCAASLGIITPANSVPIAVPKPAAKPIIKKEVAPAVKPAPKPVVKETIPIAKPTPTDLPTTNSPPLVLVPTLTPQTLKNFTNLYSKLLAVKFTPNQQQKIEQRLQKEWLTNFGLRNNVVQTIAMEPQILRGTPAERTQLQATLVGNLRQQVLDGNPDALWLISFYDASPKSWLAPGQPPLTRMTSDISADALCFMVNEVMGRPIVSADSKLKNTVAAKLTAEYANLPATTKQELFRLPANWLKFKENDWNQRGEDFREQMRVHWGQNIEAFIPEVRSMSKIRRDRLARLKASPTIPWSQMNQLQRQVALQAPDLEFQNGVRTAAQVKTVQLSNYINVMQVGSAIGNSPTRYSLKLKVK